jgi:hypothetical protein
MATKKAPANPVLPEHVVQFDEFVAKWRVLLNLRDWRIERTGKRTKAMAEVTSIEHEHKLAKYALGSDFGATPVTPVSLEKTACHELLHILLAPLIATACAEGEESDTTLEYEHAVIIVLEELLINAYGEAHAHPPTA